MHISVALLDPMAVAVLDNAHSTLNIQHIFICAIVAKLALNLANLLHYTLLVWMARCLSLRKYKTTGYFLTTSRVKGHMHNWGERERAPT